VEDIGSVSPDHRSNLNWGEDQINDIIV